MTNDVLDITMTGHLLPTDNLRTYGPLNRYVTSIDYTRPRLQNGNSALFNNDRSLDKHSDNREDIDYDNYNDYDYDYDNDNDYYYSVNRNDEVLFTF